MSKTSRNLRAFSWGKFSWTEMICVKRLTFCNSGWDYSWLGYIAQSYTKVTSHQSCSTTKMQRTKDSAHCLSVSNQPVLKTQSQLVWSFESQSWVKVKVVKWCRKKWNEHNLMYIYHKECEILQKIHWNSSNVQFRWFPIDFLWKWSKIDQ